MREVFMVYHPANVADNLVGIQSGTRKVCAEILAEWQRTEGRSVCAFGYFNSREEADEFIKERGYFMR